MTFSVAHGNHVLAAPDGGTVAIGLSENVHDTVEQRLSVTSGRLELWATFHKNGGMLASGWNRYDDTGTVIETETGPVTPPAAADARAAGGNNVNTAASMSGKKGKSA